MFNSVLVKQMLGEPFNPVHLEHEKGHRFLNQIKQEGFPSTMRSFKTHYSGLKHHPEHLSDAHNRHLLLDQDFQLILLTRKNLFHRALSFEISCHSGEWANNRKNVLQTNFPAIDIEKLEARIKAHQLEIDETHQLIAKHRRTVQEVTYEELLGKGVEFDTRAQRFRDIVNRLGIQVPDYLISRIPWDILNPKKKLNNVDTISLIPNIAEVDQHFQGMGYQSLFD